jgi:hypothetical protein
VKSHINTVAGDDSYDSFQVDVDALIANTSECRPLSSSDSSSSNGSSDDDSDNSEKQVSTSKVKDWDILGLRAFKINNNNHSMPNLLHCMPTKPIEAANYDDSIRAQIVYKDANQIIKMIQRKRKPTKIT